MRKFPVINVTHVVQVPISSSTAALRLSVVFRCILLHYCRFYSIALWTYGTCIGLDIELYLAIQLFRCKYVTIKLS